MDILLINPYDSPDYLYRSILEGLLKLNLNLYFTHPDRYATNIVSDDEAINLSSRVDFIFSFADKEKHIRPQPKFYLLDKINLPNKSVYVDGSEYNWTSYPGRTNETVRREMLVKCKYYFKRECLIEHINLGIIPLPFAAIDSDFSNLPLLNKDIDVLCAFGQLDTGLRSTAVYACEELKQEGYTIINYPTKNYYECINRSWITVDAHGGGECNARMWQIMANQTCLFAQKYNIIIPNLEEDLHYVSWNSKEDLKNKIKIYLGNKEKLSYIIRNSFNNILSNHTSQQRVNYMFNIIKETK